jgi:2-iminobutanoate/2-iminopropanoate deaminase
MKFITSGKNFAASKAPISQAVVAGNYCHTSGQLAFDSEGNFKPGTVLEECVMTFDNIFAIAAAAGFSKEQIVFIDIAFIDLNDLPAITPYYNSLFEADRKPARTIYQAAALPMGAKIKVMAIAIKE